MLAMSGGRDYALDHFRCACDLVASRFQSACGWKSDPFAAGCGIGSVGYQFVQRSPKRGLTAVS